jgi:hypothetical protein
MRQSREADQHTQRSAKPDERNARFRGTVWLPFGALLLLMAVPTPAGSTGLRITAPQDGERVAGHGLRMSFSAEFDEGDSEDGQVLLQLFLGGNRVYEAPAQHGESALEFGRIFPGFHQLEAQLVRRSGAGEDEQLGYDGIEVLTLDGGTLGPRLDDDELVAFRAQGTPHPAPRPRQPQPAAPRERRRRAHETRPRRSETGRGACVQGTWAQRSRQRRRERSTGMRAARPRRCAA